VRPGKRHLVWVYHWTREFEFALSTDALIQTSPANCGAFLFLREAEVTQQQRKDESGEKCRQETLTDMAKSYNSVNEYL
jgi:hypothetical protein